MYKIGRKNKQKSWCWNFLSYYTFA